MPSLSNRWLLALAGAGAYLAVALLFGGTARAQKDEKAPKSGEPEVKATPAYYGVTVCANEGCHGGAPKKWIPGKDLLCRCDEANLWVKNDKHADAYNVLTKARGQQMAKILGYDVTKARACLVCHGTYIDDKKVLDESVKNYSFKVEEGVNCVVCHGAYLEWGVQHGNPLSAPKWRPKSRQEKWVEGGMRDLWDPIKRAELCTSCHVGNHKEGKFVTHEMYAAGHPPLPGFEAAMFSEQMPRHWEYLREKKPAVAKELGHTPGEQEQARLLLVGSAVALRESMKLLEGQAKKALDARDDDGKALDLANFDCYACHHDLKPGSWRPKRGYPGKPGRVPMRPWPTELIQLGAAQAGGPGAAKLLAELAAGKKKLSDAFVARPYGDPARIEKAAAELRDWADTLAKKLNKPVTEKDARSLLARMPKLYGDVTLDYDSARQVGWAFDVLYNELHGYPTRRDGIPESKDTGDPKVRTAQKALGDYLRLRLPQGRTKIIEDELADNLKALNDYDPATFRKKFATLTSALGK